MAVYEHTYRRYEGALTPERTRFAVLPRYALREVFKSRLFVAFFVLCFALPFVGLILIYLHHNLSALKMLQLPVAELQRFLPIDAKFFWYGLVVPGRRSACCWSSSWGRRWWRPTCATTACRSTCRGRSPAPSTCWARSRCC